MNHYFIGYLLKPDDSKKLIGGQNFITRTLNQKDVQVLGKVTDFHTKFSYLGYLDKATELLIKDKLSNVFEAISSKFGPLEGEMTRYGLTKGIKTKKSVAIYFKNADLENIIVPYIRSYTDHMLTKIPEDFEPHISLLRVDVKDTSKILEKDPRTGQDILEKTYLPKDNKFVIDSIQFLRGKPKIARTGAPSKYDEMDIEIIDQYKLRG